MMWRLHDGQTDLLYADVAGWLAPRINPNVSKITGVICGYRVEEIEDKLMQQIRYLDKLVDELARGKAMDKILRK
jgi:hypothetical protein